MDAQNYARLQALFESARGLMPELREAFVARVRAEDPALGEALAGLCAPLASPSGARQFPTEEAVHAARRRLESVPAHAAVPADSSPRVLRLPLGEIEIRGEIGRGGMGVVLHGYDVALKREVAVKADRRRIAEGELLAKARRVPPPSE